MIKLQNAAEGSCGLMQSICAVETRGLEFRATGQRRPLQREGVAYEGFLASLISRARRPSARSAPRFMEGNCQLRETGRKHRSALGETRGHADSSSCARQTGLRLCLQLAT